MSNCQYLINYTSAMQHLNDNRLPAKALKCHIQRKRNRKRISKKWTDNIKEDARDLGLKTNDRCNKRSSQVETLCYNLIVGCWLIAWRENKKIWNICKCFHTMCTTT